MNSQKTSPVQASYGASFLRSLEKGLGLGLHIMEFQRVHCIEMAPDG